MTSGSINANMIKRLKQNKMKTLTKLIALLLISAISFSLQAQTAVTENPKYGEDPSKRLENAKMNSLYREFYRQKNYTDALAPWRYVFFNAPKISSNLYKNGEKIMTYFIKRSKDKDVRQKYVDTLMMVYDQRLEHFPKKRGYVLGKKGVKLAQYRPEASQQIYDILKEAIDIDKNKTSGATLVNYLMASKVLFTEEKIEAGKVIEDYALCIDIANVQLKAKPDDKRALKAKSDLDKVIEGSGALDSQSVIAQYGPRLEANPNDKDLLLKIHRLLTLTDGTEEELYFKVSENLYKIDPNASAAFGLSNMFRAQGKMDKAKQYILEAIEKEEDKIKISDYYFRLSDLVFREFNDLPTARTYAKKAASADPTSGKPYLMLGMIYGAAKNCAGEGEVGKVAIYWLVVDKLKIAKRKDPALAETVNKMLTSYAARFPKEQQMFFEDIIEGSEYTIKCWINEKTTARARK